MEMAQSDVVVGLSTFLFPSQKYATKETTVPFAPSLVCPCFLWEVETEWSVGNEKKTFLLVDGIISFFPVLPEPFMAIQLEEYFLEGQWHAGVPIK